ncbi:conserved hypothetical protein [Nitrosopumilaceae archaeon]|nr:DUF4065 domain-containing protein [Nitrosopumilus sp.]CAI9832216.1 conserved hypothetical protein [Nitrosopumilaceae archaeon]MDA7942257.1 DUF4065 domain-containing protein [Nitrosopumilus sp.]MDA7944135.1 DUF4065 domain-containing protein [Nitrosopumilus sp.]MDA7945519.1 DUF4065 domain-containing protein [Nitrosopumilus sp.]
MAQVIGQREDGSVPAILVGDYITAMGGGRFTPMQILKLAYLGHGFTLGITGQPLFRDRIEAWKYGPVIPALYDAIRAHGGAPVPRLYSCGTPVTSPDIGKRMDELGGRFTANNLAIVRKTVETYGEYEEFLLSYITHMDGSPWKRAFDRGGLHARIEDDDLKSYYREQLKE